MKTTLWCCVQDNYYSWYSLAKTRTASIGKGSDSPQDWIRMKKRGWKCIKVSVDIKPIK